MSETEQLTQDEVLQRKTFLIEMYKQLFANINRHILVVWQGVAVLAGAVALFALVERAFLSLDLACSFFVLLLGWFVAHVLDASTWFNRNLAIMTNVERDFLRDEDLSLIHYYFGKPRPNNRMISHFSIQVAFALALAVLVLGTHFAYRVVPGFALPLSKFDWTRALPYVVLSVTCLYLLAFWRKTERNYSELLKNSPGRTVDITSVVYNSGHGQGKKWWQLI
ncbi:MAG: hypothetical protein EPO20_13195 [Betaproteobacteria bacterium]|nr:MAG: hypothetical protein EPO20_13195 [Betaproteobacteria bacterium]